MFELVLVVLSAVQAAKVVNISPQECGASRASTSTATTVDCHATIAGAITTCKEYSQLNPDTDNACSVVLAPGTYTVRCPPQSSGAYIYPLGAVGAAAVDLSNSTYSVVWVKR